MTGVLETDSTVPTGWGTKDSEDINVILLNPNREKDHTNLPGWEEDEMRTRTNVVRVCQRGEQRLKVPKQAAHSPVDTDIRRVKGKTRTYNKFSTCFRASPVASTVT